MTTTMLLTVEVTKTITGPLTVVNKTELAVTVEVIQTMMETLTVVVKLEVAEMTV